jgi:RsiW-degrading membrane proteinase PrsW (M82 family)
VNSLINKIPEILENSGNLFGFFVLLVLVITFLNYVFYIRAEKADRNRAFILILLFFFGLVIAALSAAPFHRFNATAKSNF